VGGRPTDNKLDHHHLHTPPTHTTIQGRGRDMALKDTIKKYFWMLEGARCFKECATHARNLFFYFFYILSNIKLPLSWYNNNKKNYCKRWKKTPNTNFNFVFAFKDILIVLLCFYIYIYIYIYIYLIKYQIVP